MKDLIVYYSLEGNTEYVVNRIKEKTGADVLKLVPKKAYADQAFEKLAKYLGISSFDAKASFLDPKLIPDEKKDSEIDNFAELLAM